MTKCVVGEPRGRAVVEDEAVLAQHQAVARLADRQRREGVGVDPVEEGGRVRALDVDLAEGRDVADADAARAPPSPRGSPRRASRVSPGCGKYCARSQRPVSTNTAPCSSRPVMRRREPRRAEILAAMMAGERADRDRRVGRPEGRGADVARYDCRAARPSWRGR